MHELSKKMARNNTDLNYIPTFFLPTEMYDFIGNKWMHAYVRKYDVINKVKDIQFLVCKLA